MIIFLFAAQVNPHAGNGASSSCSHKASFICARDKAWLLQNSTSWFTGKE